MKIVQSQSNNSSNQTQNAGEVANGKSTAFEKAEKEAFNSPQNKTINGSDDDLPTKNGENNEQQTAPHLQDELTIGNNKSWNQSAPNDGNSEQAELDKNVKKKPVITEVESKETREKRINQASIGDAF